MSNVLISCWLASTTTNAVGLNFRKATLSTEAARFLGFGYHFDCILISSIVSAVGWRVGWRRTNDRRTNTERGLTNATRRLILEGENHFKFHSPIRFLEVALPQSIPLVLPRKPSSTTALPQAGSGWHAARRPSGHHLWHCSFVLDNNYSINARVRLWE
jgi:hypothetical protein